MIFGPVTNEVFYFDHNVHVFIKRVGKISEGNVVDVAKRGRKSHMVIRSSLV